MRPLIILCVLLPGCVSGRSPSVDVDVSFSEPSPTVFEKVANVTGASGFVDRKVEHAVAEAKATIVIPALEGALADLKGAKHSSPAPVSTGNVEPVAEEVKPEVKVNPRLRVLMFTSNDCAWCEVAKKTLKDRGIKTSLSHADDYVLVNVDEPRNKELNAYYKPKSFPSWVIVNKAGEAKWASVGANIASSVPGILAELRRQDEEKSVLQAAPKKTAACQCSPCTCVNCACGMQMQGMVSGGCSTCQVKRGRWR